MIHSFDIILCKNTLFLADISKRLLGDLPISLKSFTCPRFSQSSFGLHLVLKIVRSSPAFFIVRWIVLGFSKRPSVAFDFSWKSFICHRLFSRTPQFSSSFPKNHSAVVDIPQRVIQSFPAFPKSCSIIFVFRKRFSVL